MVKLELESVLKIITYCFLFSIITISFWAYNWKASAEFDALVLFFIAYTLLLVLPISDFELGPFSFKGKMKQELKRLTEETRTVLVPPETLGGIQNDMRVFRSRSSNDIILMKLSIEIETTLRDMAESQKMYDKKYQGRKVGMAQLIEFLRIQKIITDKWLLDALHFFRVHRNELLHKGKTDDLAKAIDVGTKVLAELKEIQNRLRVK
jgi:hypothetical protein